MPITSTNQNTLNTLYVKVIWLKIGETDLYFEAKKKEDNTYNVVSRGDVVSGRLKEITVKEYESNGKLCKSVNFTFIDDEDTKIILNLGINKLSRQVLNLLINSDKLDVLDFKLYRNKKNYACMEIKNNWEKLGWKYDFNDLNKKVDYIKNKKGEVISADYSELDEWFINEIIPEIAQKINRK